jgi:hypothetical protein
MPPDRPEDDRARAGLCGSCRQMLRRRNDRGSIFYYCRRSEADPSYPRYPGLPVTACDGFEPARDQEQAGPAGTAGRDHERELPDETS